MLICTFREVHLPSVTSNVRGIAINDEIVISPDGAYVYVIGTAGGVGVFRRDLGS